MGTWDVSPCHAVGWPQPMTCLAGSEYKLAGAGRQEIFSHTGCCPEFFSPSLVPAVITFLCKRRTSCKQDFAPSPTSRQDCWVFSKSSCATSAPLEDIHPWVGVPLLPDDLWKALIPDLFMRLGFLSEGCVCGAQSCPCPLKPICLNQGSCGSMQTVEIFKTRSGVSS